MVYECVFDNCNRTFEKPWRLEEHICSHTGDRPFLCEEPGCEKTFVRKAHLTRHLLTHSDERPFTCSICNAGFKSKQALNKHSVSHGTVKPQLQCHVEGCSELFLKKTHLYKHVIDFHKIKSPYACDLCQQSFTTQSHLTRHKERIHLSEYMCTDCYEKFDKFSALQKHISKAHPKRQPRCSKCNLHFSNQTNYNAHIRTVHMKSDDEESSVMSQEVRTEILGPGSIKSEGKSAASSDVDADEVLGHLAGFAGDIQEDNLVDESSFLEPESVDYTCKTCNKVYRSQQFLVRHMKLAHDITLITEFKCSECSGIFKHKSNLLRHIQSKHQKVKRFKCGKCEKEFFYKQAYQRHVRIMHEETRTSEKVKPWNKRTLNEEISGHIEDDDFRNYVDDMRERGFKAKRGKVEAQLQVVDGC